MLTKLPVISYSSAVVPLVPREPAVISEEGGSHKDLTAKVVVGHPAVSLTESKVDDEPFTGGTEDQVSVADSLYPEASKVAVSEHRIAAVALKGSPHGLAACVCYHVTVFRTALSGHKVVVVTDMVHMRGLQVSAS